MFLANILITALFIYAAVAGFRFVWRSMSRDKTVDYYQKRIAELESENAFLRGIITRQDEVASTSVVKVIDGGVLVPHRRH
jgi:cell division protein FtsB